MPDQPELQKQLAEVLLEHTARHNNNGVDLWLWCGCGDGVRYYDRRKHGAHVTQALLSLPGIAITALPTPESTTTDIDGDGLKTAQFPHDITAWGGEYPGVMDCDADMSIEVARSLAASLLAAANFAESDAAEAKTNA